MKTRSLISSLVVILSFAMAPGLRAAIEGAANSFTQSTDQNGNHTIAALTGTITITFDDGSGKAPIKLDAGTGTVLDAQNNQVKGPNGEVIQPLAALLTNPSFVSAVEQTIKAVAATIAAGGDSAATNNATTQLAALIKAVSAADPAHASSYVTTAVAALTQNGASGDAVQNAITTSIAAANNAPGVDASSVSEAANNAASANHVSYTPPATAVQTQAVLNQVLTTTPTPIDVSVISRSKK